MNQLDSWFSYSTVKVVEVKDRRLGLLWLWAIVCIVIYISVYVFAIQKGYLSVQYTTGIVATKIKGKARTINSTSSFWDEADVVVPALEPGATFIATRVQQTLGQKLGTCASSPSINCTLNPTCTTPDYLDSGHCNEATGLCEFYQWCHDEVDNAKPGNPITHVHYLDGIQNFTIWFKASIRFDQLGEGDRVFFSTIHDSQPITPAQDPQKANLYTVEQLLSKLPSSQRQHIYETGAILRVIVNWNCNIDNGACDLSYDLVRLDDPNVGSGFNFRTSMAYTNATGTHRDLYKFIGLRFFVDSTGKGYKVSIAQIILNIASGVALFGVATVLVDFLALRVFKQRELFKHYKVQEVEANDIHDVDKVGVAQSLVTNTAAYGTRDW
eukprot:TRINITY_DN33509_c0_g1_i1.p1 TRINITY_DN33509_c0_g1~~TRINITY_DN33509_c0_g1_i1.p1  ORF type:complete len:383 (-),score=47.17 TRINITY_DN33509_c0_g1_i1:8-1156(-)